MEALSFSSSSPFGMFQLVKVIYMFISHFCDLEHVQFSAVVFLGFMLKVRSLTVSLRDNQVRCSAERCCFRMVTEFDQFRNGPDWNLL